jgi:multimeric flavodoxin WrbA
MEKAGAKVETMFPATMNITPCKGCFHCWAHNKRNCIYHEKDDMKIFLEKYEKCDLLVWSTPIYLFHCASSMKNIMDRLFITVDSHILLNPEKKEMHPCKYSRSPYQAILAVAGFTDMDVFKPLQATMKTWEKHAAFKLLGELYRPGAMSFLLENIINIKKDIVLASLERAAPFFSRLEHDKTRTFLISLTLEVICKLEGTFHVVDPLNIFLNPNINASKLPSTFNLPDFIACLPVIYSPFT